MTKKLALISVGMNTPLKLEEERIWANWFRGMFGDDVYLINNISSVADGEKYEKHPLLDYSQSFSNPGHIPGVCDGLMLGLQHLKLINYKGPVVLTVCDVIADEDFRKVIDLTEFDADVYTHDWGPNHVATDWIFLTQEVWPHFNFPLHAGHVNETGDPIMKDEAGRTFIAPAGWPILEEWNNVYIREQGWRHKHIIGNESPAWTKGETNIGTRINISNIEFNIIQSGGDARPTKTHLTNKYMEFDRPYEN